MIIYKTEEAFFFHWHRLVVKLPETQRERKSEARSDPLDREKSGEHIWIAAPAASSCQLLSLAGGEESNGIYTSRQKSRRAPEVLFFHFSPNSINHLAGVSHKVWHNSVQVHVCVCEEVSFKPECEANNPYVQVEWNVISQTLKLAGGERWESTAPLGTSECRLSRKNNLHRRPETFRDGGSGLESTGGVLHNRSKTFKSHSTDSRSNIIIFVFACVHCCFISKSFQLPRSARTNSRCSAKALCNKRSAYRCLSIAEREICWHYCTAVNLFNFIFVRAHSWEQKQGNVWSNSVLTLRTGRRSVDIYLISFFLESFVCAKKVRLSKATPWTI